jgi:DNA-binding NarL/FixJ family response regulator
VPIRVLIVDASSAVRARLRQSLAQCADFEVVGDWADSSEGLEQCLQLRPDLMIVDVTHPSTNGVAILDRLRRAQVPTRTVALSNESSPQWMRWAKEAGASGYLLMDGDLSNLCSVLRAIHAGDSVLPPPGSDPDPAERRRASLTERENQIVQLIAAGRTSRQISDLFHISARTVEAHRSSIMKKLGTHSIAELIRWEMQGRGAASPPRRPEDDGGPGETGALRA